MSAMWCTAGSTAGMQEQPSAMSSSRGGHVFRLVVFFTVMFAIACINHKQLGIYVKDPHGQYNTEIYTAQLAFVLTCTIGGLTAMPLLQHCQHVTGSCIHSSVTYMGVCWIRVLPVPPRAMTSWQAVVKVLLLQLLAWVI